jgi:predicted nucleic acid-binding protein
MKETYLLDTCSLISLKKNYADGHEQHVIKLSSLNNDDEVCASILSIYELSAGASHARLLTESFFCPLFFMLIWYFSKALKVHVKNRV